MTYFKKEDLTYLLEEFRQAVGQLDQKHIGWLAGLLKKYRTMDVKKAIKHIPPGHPAPMAYVSTLLQKVKMKSNPKFNLKVKVGKNE